MSGVPWKTTRRLTVPLTLFLAITVQPPVGAFELVTPKEAGQAGTDIPKSLTLVPKKADTNAPAIVLRSPDDIEAELASPIDIELGFEAMGDATLDMDSLRVLYDGFLRLDITDRLFEHADISEGSLRAEDAELPPGRHELIVQISDNLGRQGNREFLVRVAR